MASVSSHAAGRFCWVELGTTDQTAAAYTLRPEQKCLAPHWQVYFQVEDAERSAEKAKGLGAAVTMGPQDIPEVGRFAMLRDPQGAAFYVFQPTAPASGGGRS